MKIELIKIFSQYRAYNIYGRIYDFIDDYVLLIYSSTDYDKTMKKISTYRSEKNQKQIEKEREQNSYF